MNDVYVVVLVCLNANDEAFNTVFGLFDSYETAKNELTNHIMSNEDGGSYEEYFKNHYVDRFVIEKHSMNEFSVAEEVDRCCEFGWWSDNTTK